MDTEDKIKEIRLDKAKKLENLGREAYPSHSDRNVDVFVVKKNFCKWSLLKKKVIIAGRIMSQRGQGGIMFLNLRDASGDLQLVFKKDTLSDLNVAQNNLDLGDFIECEGCLFKTQRGEKSLLVKKWKMLSKSLKPLPSEWYGLKDTEERFRRRYVDLILNQDVKDRFVLRSKIIQLMREFLDKSGFLEVETPILQKLHGGALARPFKTKINALNMDLYLRIAPELYLKRLIVGGFEKIYEIGRNFRNEGVDRNHNPEFTMMELYWAYQDYEGLMGFMEDLMIYILKKAMPVAKNPLLVNYNGTLLNFQKPWPRKNFRDVIKEYSGLDFDESSEKEILEVMKNNNLEISEQTKKQNRAELLDEIFKKICLPKLIQPAFLIHHPAGISPLSKLRKDNKGEAERFQAICANTEFLNGYSELNDPQEQAKRFKDQEERIIAGNEEASRFDQDYIEALEYGMPPTAGVGIGIDRLVMILTNTANIKEIILFPFMRNKEE
jgi:lysyl-tRNA synthetase class 2